MRLTPWLSLAAVLFTGCLSPSAETPPKGGSDRCGLCAEGQICDAATSTCVPALSEGAACGTAPDGTAIAGACVAGLSCGAVSGDQTRCTKDCTAKNAAEVCGADLRCFARPGSTGNGFCARTASEGEACDSAKVTFCSGAGLSCITPTADATAGRCFAHCDPNAAMSQCAANQVCADPFTTDPTFGICVTPAGAYPNKCDHTQLQFCGRGELCARPGDASFGYCHRRCAASTDCTGGEACVEGEGGIRFCTQAVPRDQHCAASEDRYCAPGDLCVRVGTDTVCRADCSKGETCLAGTRCSALEGSTRKACL